MEHLLRTPQGTTAYASRSSLIEPIFGDRKHNRQIRSFRPPERCEWAFIHLTGNIRKLYQPTPRRDCGVSEFATERSHLSTQR